MRKYLKILGVFVLVLLCLTGCKGSVDTGIYEVILPAGYEESINDYPVLYILPQNGHFLDDSGMTERFVKEMEEGQMLDMIIVRPEFEKEADVIEEMKKIVASVESEYKVIKTKKHRVLAGTGVGGYLAYTAGLADRETFGVMASVRGDFASEENAWIQTYGNVSDSIDKMLGFGEGYFDEIYTYMDAPVNDAWTDMEGSTNDLGAMFIEMGTSASAHEFTVRPGEYNDEFLDESVNRLGDRLTTHMLGETFTGTVKLENATLPEEEANAKVLYSVDVANSINSFTLRDFEMEVAASVVDPLTGEVLDVESAVVEVMDDGTYEGEIAVENLVNGDSSEVVLSVNVFGGEFEIASATLRRGQGNVLDGEMQVIDLSGDWYFNYTGMDETLDIKSITPNVYKEWSVVQPGDGKWREGYGNIDKNTVSGPAEYFTYMLTGNGYYVKTFELPEEFNSVDVTLSIGYVDDRCEVFLNGKKVGATGMNDSGEPNGETTWANLSEFAIDPELLVRGGENTVIVRAWNDEPYGEGGWYDGPVSLSGKRVEEKEDTTVDEGQPKDGSDKQEVISEEEKEYFYEETFKTSATKKGKYLIYLPQDYYETEKYYPTMYLLHQFNSDHTSYKTDNIDQILNEGIENGLFDEMIVVIPNSSEESWWTGKWEKMLTEDLISHIDKKYRTINDARYRMTAGCSMGGQGAFGVALTNPEYFSGAASFFGALNMAPTMEEDAILIAGAESKEYLDYFSYSFICGNQDSYGFGVPAIELHQILKEKEVDHYFFIENGGHDSDFYLPYFNECIGYVRSNMYQTDDAIEKLVKASAEVDGTKVKVTFEAEAEIDKYFGQYSENTLRIPLIIQIMKDGEVIHTKTVKKNTVSAEQMSAEYEFDFAKKLKGVENFEVVVKAAVFDKVVEMK